MISFRFHLISLIAVFLALAIGITVGATVVDKATVSLLENRLSDVERRVNNTNRENDALSADVDRWKTFGDQSTAALVKGRLSGVPVLMIGVRGSDTGLVSKLRDLLVAAGAKVEGTLWFTPKMALDPKKPDDASALADALGLQVVAPDSLRQVALSRLAAAWGTSGKENPLSQLRQAGFVDYDSPPGPSVDLATVPAPSTRFIVVSQSSAAVPNEVLAGPFTAALAKASSSRVVAVEPGTDATPGKPADRATFVGPLRSDGQIGPLLSTVDDLEDVRGQLAAVLAVADLASGRLGHYGVGPRATRLLPDETAQ